MVPKSLKETCMSFAFVSHSSILAWPNLQEKGHFLRKVCSGKPQEGPRQKERGWVSRNRGLNPYHFFFLHQFQLLQNSLHHIGSSQRNLELLQCHRGNVQGNPSLLWLYEAMAVTLLQHFSKGPRLGHIAIKELQNKHK